MDSTVWRALQENNFEFSVCADRFYRKSGHGVFHVIATDTRKGGVGTFVVATCSDDESAEVVSTALHAWSRS